MALSSNALAAIHARETGELFCYLVEITHPNLTTPVRVTNAGKNLTSNSNVFTNVPFDIQLPNAKEGATRSAKLTIDNIDQSIAAAVYNMDEPASIKVQIVLESTPDVIEQEFDNFELVDATVNQFTVSATFATSGLESKGVPRRRFTPDNTPGLFT